MKYPACVGSNHNGFAVASMSRVMLALMACKADLSDALATSSSKKFFAVMGSPLGFKLRNLNRKPSGLPTPNTPVVSVVPSGAASPGHVATVAGAFLHVNLMHHIRPLHTLTTAEVQHLAVDAFNRDDDPRQANPFTEGSDQYEQFMDAYGACEFMSILAAA